MERGESLRLCVCTNPEIQRIPPAPNSFVCVLGFFFPPLDCRPSMTCRSDPPARSGFFIVTVVREQGHPISLSLLGAGTNEATAKTSNHSPHSNARAEAGLSHPSVLPQDAACRTQEDSERCDPQCSFWGSGQQVYPAPAGSCC